MPARLVALEEGPDIPLDGPMIVVGRHPQCNARLDSLRVSRHHCCMTYDHGDVIVRDLGSTNGIRINGQRVEFGRLKSGDELSIAHIRYRLENGQGHEATIADRLDSRGEVLQQVAPPGLAMASHASPNYGGPVAIHAEIGEHRLAAAVRELLPSNLADRCKIQVIVQVPEGEEVVDSAGSSSSASARDADECPPDSSR